MDYIITFFLCSFSCCYDYIINVNHRQCCSCCLRGKIIVVSYGKKLTHLLCLMCFTYFYPNIIIRKPIKIDSI